MRIDARKGSRRGHHVLRWIALIATLLVVLAGIAYAVLRIELEGPALATNLASQLNKRMRGRIAVGSVEWEPAALKAVLTGGWASITLRDVTVWDDCALTANASGATADELRTGDPNLDCTPDEHPDPVPGSRRKPRKVLVRAPSITAEIDVHAALFGRHDLVFRNVWLHGGEALIEQVAQPYPLHAYDQTIVSIISAFYPREKAGFRAGLYADSAPPIVDVRDIHIEHLNVTLHMSPTDGGPGRIMYGMTARLEDVNVDAGPRPRNDAYLYMDASDPLVAKFYVRLGVTAPRGIVRTNDLGPRATFRIPDPVDGRGLASERGVVYPVPGRTADYQFALADVQLDRLAQLPSDWTRHDYVANTLELDLRARTVPCTAAGQPVPDPHDPAVQAQSASLHITGQLHDYWDRPYDGAWDLKLAAKNLGPTIRTCVKSTVSGDALDGTITLTGPFVARPAIGLDLTNLDVAVPLQANQPPLELTLAEVHGHIDMVNEQGYIDQTKALVRGGKEPGEIHLAATFGLAPYNANAHVEIAKAIDVARFLPPSIVEPVGRYLHGELNAKGDVSEGFALEDFDLALGATPTTTAIRVHKGRVFTGDNFATVNIDKVWVDAGQTHGLISGAIDLVKDHIHLEVTEGVAPDLGLWLQRFGIGAFAASAGGGAHVVIDGKLTNPTVTVSTELSGVPCLDKVKIVNARLADGVLEGAFNSGSLGGTLEGTVRMDTATKRIEKLTVTGSRLDASRVCGSGGALRGTIDKIEVSMTNTVISTSRDPIDWLSHVQAYAQARKLSVRTDRYTDTFQGIGLCLNRSDDGACRPRPQYLDSNDLAQCAAGRKSGFCAVVTATRDSGGVLDATISRIPASRTGSGRTAKVTPEQLGGTVSMHDLPLAALSPFVGTGVTGGVASVTLHLQGSIAAPQAIGAVDVLRAWVKDSFIGDAQLAIEPAALGSSAGLAIHGTALAGRLRITGTLGTAAPYPVELAVSGRRIELDAFKDLQAILGLPEPAQAWVSGTVTVKTELAPRKPIAPEAWIELSELEGVYDLKTADGRNAPLRVRVLPPTDRAKETAVSLHLTPTAMELACRDPQAPTGRRPCTTRLGTPAGIVEVHGQVTASGIAIKAGGVLDLGLVAPLLDSTFDTLTGTATLDASLAGTLAQPVWEAALELKDVVARPVGGETVLTAPSGLIKVANGSLGFTDVRVQVRDQNRDEAGELHIKGNIGLAGLTPVSWGVLVSGTLAGKMLLVAAPRQIAQASGLARIEGDLLLTGKGRYPTVSGTVDFAPLPLCPAGKTETVDGTECRGPKELVRPLSIIPRGVRRELAFESGSIDLESVPLGAAQQVSLTVNDVRASIDGEGALTGINGAIAIDDGVPTDVSLSLNADKIPFRSPTLDLVLRASDISIEKHGSGAPTLVGTVQVDDGTYRRDVEIADQITSLGSTSPPTIPFWETYPTLASTNLDLTLIVQRFAVLNNVAQIYFTGQTHISGTPRDPRLAGQITVSRGTFRIPGTRAKFDQTSGRIDFTENEPAGNPTLAVTSDANFRDQSGQDHLITLSISGALSQLQWDLKTSTGYNKSQTLSLLVLGRGPEALRRTLGDQSIGNDPTRIDPTTNPSQGFADQIVKDLAGDWVVGTLGDSLGRLTGLDVFRVEVGFNSIGLHIEKNILENLKVLGDTEQTFYGNTVNARIELDTPRRVRVQAGYLGKNFNDPAEQDIRDATASVKRTWKFFVP